MPLRDGQGTTPANDSAVAERIGNGQVVEFDDFIEAQLRKTRSHVRSVDIATGLMLLAAGTLAYILLAAVVDHWIVTGGLGFWGRTVFLLVYLVAAGAYLASSVLPLLLRRINPLYAAETIERSHPSLKNALVNFLFFRGHRERLSAVIYQAVEEQAARNLAGTQADTAVDRSRLIKIGYVLLGILLACAVYALVSPKNLFRTVGRIAVPWAEIDAPTRTTISEIEPRDAQAFRGQQITVSARIKDLPADASVRLIYTTADGQTVDRAIEMTPGEDGYKHACLLPEGDASLQQDLEYHIEAGDAITRPFHLDVVAAPTVFVEAVETKYPAYTGLLAQRVERQGDVKAIEGSQITIDALANSDIRTAHVDFDCDGSLDQRMTVDGRRAKVTFPLALADDRRTAEHSSYQLVFTNAQGQRNPQPVRHQIEVTRDIPPEISFVAPTNDPIDVPVNGALTLEVVAIDPDFALGLVKLSIAQGEKPLADKLLVSDTHRGQFVGKYRFEPQVLGLKPGDLVTYAAVAEDNKVPNPNRTETAKRRIRVAAPGEQQGQQDQVTQNDGAGEGRSQPDDGKGQRQQGQRDADMPPDENAGKPGAEPQDAADKAAASGESVDGQPAARGGDRQPDTEQTAQGKQPPAQGKQQSEAAGDQDPPGEGPQQGDRAGTKQQGENGKSGDESQAAPAGEQGEQQGAGNNESGSGEEASVPSDGSNDGDAIERILEHRDQNQPASDQRPGDQRQQQGDDKHATDSKSDGRDESQPQQGAKKRESADRQQDRGDRQPSDEAQGEPAGGKPADEQGGGGNKQRDAVPGERESGNQVRSGGKSGKPMQSDDTASTSKQGKQPPADQQQGEAGEKKAGDQRDTATDADETGPGESQPKPGQRGGREGQKQGQSGEQAEQQQGADQKGADQNDAQSTEKQPGDKQAAERNSQTDEQRPAEEGQGQGKSKDGQGAQSKNDPMGNKNAPSRDAKRSDTKGGDGEQQKGESGAGQKSTDKQGSPSPQETAKPRDKSQPPTPGDQDAKDPNDAQSPSQTQNESDSQGQDDGDRSGGGKRGGGQKANKPGTGGAGQNTAADEGAGASEQAGDGETSDRAGDDKAAEGQTGKSGDQRGKGSQSQLAGENDGDPAVDGSSGEGGAAGDSPKSDSSDEQSAPGGGAPTGGKPGAEPEDGTPAERPYRTAPEAADEANLDYARKATDLALSHLKDELAKDQPDADLLKDLGWTRDDLQKFVSRWEQMRRDAQSPGVKGETARRELDETLQSLGLRPRATSLRANDARDDSVKGMRESRRSSPPPEYAEQVKAYTQGTARGGK
ncbi:MAG: hypothetical protein WD845_10815 [Pirellulales bacterium]